MELLKQCQLSSVADKFLKNNITARIIWDLDDEILSSMDLTAIDRLKYYNARDEHGDHKKQGNPIEIELH